MFSPPAPGLVQQPSAPSYHRPAIVTLVLFLLFAAWDTTSLDLAMARWFGGLTKEAQGRIGTQLADKMRSVLVR